MFDSAVLEVVIGLIFIYLLLSLLATTINEIIMSLLRARGEELHKAIMIMLGDRNINSIPLDQSSKDKQRFIGDAFYNHPLIKKFAEKGKDNKPSYLTNSNFSKVLLDLIKNYEALPENYEELKTKINEKFPKDTALLINSFLDESEGDIAVFKLKLENWFDQMMDRATGWYKRRVQKLLILIGFLMAVVLNADTFQIAKNLSQNEMGRLELVKQAGEFLEERGNTANSNNASLNIDSLKNSMIKLLNDDLNKSKSIVGMGWSDDAQYLAWSERHPSEKVWPFWILTKIFGWLLTAIAISLGAPFWFDLLNKIMKIRGTGVKPEEKPEEKKVYPEQVKKTAPREHPGSSAAAENVENTPAYG